MSDEYSLHTRFLLGLDSAAEYERRLERLHRAEQGSEDERQHAELACPAAHDSEEDSR